MKKYDPANVRSPDSQNDYSDWEMKVIKAVHGQGISVYQLSHVIPRTTDSIKAKASRMGCSLRASKKNNKADANLKVFSVIESLGLATAPVIIKESGLPEHSARTCLRYLVDSNLIRCRTHKKRGYVYYI